MTTETPSGSKPSLPNHSEAEIDIAKFYSYSMNPMNCSNQGKWEAFENFGYNIRNEESRIESAKNVIDQLKNGLPYAEAIPGKMTPYGQRYKVGVLLEGSHGEKATLVTTWQVDTGTTFPRLITNWLDSMFKLELANILINS